MQYHSIRAKILSFYNTYVAWAAKHRRLAQLITLVMLSLPVIVFCREILFSGNLIVAGDYSYYLTKYEAIRRSILEFHQFPW